MVTTWVNKDGPVKLATNIDRNINTLKDPTAFFKKSPGSDHVIWVIAEVPDSTYEFPEGEKEKSTLPKQILRTATTVKLKAEND